MSADPERGPCRWGATFEVQGRESWGCSTCGSMSAQMKCGLGFWEESTDYAEAKDVRRKMRHGWACEMFTLAPDCGPEDVAYLSPKDEV